MPFLFHETYPHLDRNGITAVVSFTKEVNPQLAKHLLKTNGRLANLELNSLVKEATVLMAILLKGINFTPDMDE